MQKYNKVMKKKTIFFASQKIFAFCVTKKKIKNGIHLK